VPGAPPNMLRSSQPGHGESIREDRAADISQKSGRGPCLVEEFLGSTQIFSVALSDVFEATILRELSTHNLTVPQMKVLKLIAQTRMQTVGDVAAFLGISDAAASKAIDRLVRRELVQRSEREHDRRTSEVGLTPAGRQLWDEYEEARTRRLAEIFGQFPAAQLQKTAALLDRLARSIVTHSAHPEQVCLQCEVFFKRRCMAQEASRRSCPYRKRVARHVDASSGAGSGNLRRPAEG